SLWHGSGECKRGYRNVTAGRKTHLTAARLPLSHFAAAPQNVGCPVSSTGHDPVRDVFPEIRLAAWRSRHQATHRQPVRALAGASSTRAARYPDARHAMGSGQDLAQRRVPAAEADPGET